MAEHKPREFQMPCWVRQVLLYVTTTTALHSGFARTVFVIPVPGYHFNEVFFSPTISNLYLWNILRVILQYEIRGDIPSFGCSRIGCQYLRSGSMEQGLSWRQSNHTTYQQIFHFSGNGMYRDRLADNHDITFRKKLCKCKLQSRFRSSESLSRLRIFLDFRVNPIKLSKYN
jgi:hypothetical protein